VKWSLLFILLWALVGIGFAIAGAIQSRKLDKATVQCYTCSIGWVNPPPFTSAMLALPSREMAK
jgi:hypothetical protein